MSSPKPFALSSFFGTSFSPSSQIVSSRDAGHLHEIPPLVQLKSLGPGTPVCETVKDLLSHRYVLLP